MVCVCVCVCIDVHDHWPLPAAETCLIRRARMYWRRLYLAMWCTSVSGLHIYRGRSMLASVLCRALAVTRSGLGGKKKSAWGLATCTPPLLERTTLSRENTHGPRIPEYVLSTLLRRLGLDVWLYTGRAPKHVS